MTDPILASRSTQNWHAFTRYVSYAAVAIIAVLCLMGLFLT